MKTKRKQRETATELQFQQHCKSFVHFTLVANSLSYFDTDNNILGICFCDNSNPRNNKYYIYKKKG